MKKSIKKLSLNKTTISNLDASVMQQRFGGQKPTATPAPGTKLQCSVTCQSYEALCDNTKSLCPTKHTIGTGPKV